MIGLMKPKLLLDYDAILANSPHRSTCPSIHRSAISEKKSDPLAFAIVLDKSGSMEGAPIANAKRAARWSCDTCANTTSSAGCL